MRSPLGAHREVELQLLHGRNAIKFHSECQHTLQKVIRILTVGIDPTESIAGFSSDAIPPGSHHLAPPVALTL